MFLIHESIQPGISRGWYSNYLFKLETMSSEISTILVLIAGGHSSGKECGATLLKEQLLSRFKHDVLNIQTINMQDYMSESAGCGSRAPLQFNFDQIKNDLTQQMNDGISDVIILYGLYALYDKEIVEMATIRTYIDCDADVRLGRWIKRDILQDEKDGENEQKKLELLLNVYLNYSRHEMKTYIQDTRERADVILPRGADPVGFTLVLDGIQPLLIKKLERKTVSFSDTESSLSVTPNIQQPQRSFSTSSMNRETVISHLKELSQEPSVKSLSNDNFANSNKIYYELN
ncbi:uncharacterized protein C5L36_0E03010 [Pichia kudriavzevii]|uniref:Phosphoribulokinase/uridine kinase domain-containing protein n=2 Tax=Pichia kudriavzevii TaxID=4909 RepID=A0A2U9RBL2_PICKU|nr:uncharacterized protein C5L36_0E03010 [Pichia kudriavzevii]AWU78239.1 hypothetical protein C5L36_0E03010 [Pichia kudriavzevii]